MINNFFLNVMNCFTSLPVRWRVARGVALMDSRTPGWHKDIDIESLNIEDSHCVLGQVYGGYHYGKVFLSIDGCESVSHGFCPDWRAFNDNAVLTSAWRDVILRRREAYPRFADATVELEYEHASV